MWRGEVAEWFRALDLKSGGHWFKSSTLPLSGFAFGNPTSWDSQIVYVHFEIFVYKVFISFIF